jgi:hypothetical protein
MAGWYLAQEFTADAPGTQVFLAPGPEDVPLQAEPSPWVRGRMVRLPGRYWHRLLRALRDRAPDVAELLDGWSGTADPDDVADYLPTETAIAAVRKPLRDLAVRLRGGDAVTDEELAQLGDYTRHDMAAMLEAVLQVVETAVTRHEAFSAWPE